MVRTRTIISLPDEDKQWLDHYSHLRHQSIAHIIRVAIRQFKQRAAGKTRSQALAKTAGLLKGGEDSVEFVRRLRQEWDD